MRGVCVVFENETERKLAVVAVVDAEMRRIGFRAVVIGGLAVELTRGAYSTADIDLYLPHGPAVLQLLEPLGFERRGRAITFCPRRTSQSSTIAVFVPGTIATSASGSSSTP